MFEKLTYDSRYETPKPYDWQLSRVDAHVMEAGLCSTVQRTSAMVCLVRDGVWAAVPDGRLSVFR